ncbi:MAG: tetratricopeptide repeat protein [Bacteroidota bacterium]
MEKTKKYKLLISGGSQKISLHKRWIKMGIGGIFLLCLVLGFSSITRKQRSQKRFSQTSVVLPVTDSAPKRFVLPRGKRIWLPVDSAQPMRNRLLKRQMWNIIYSFWLALMGTWVLFSSYDRLNKLGKMVKHFLLGSFISNLVLLSINLLSNLGQLLYYYQSDPYSLAEKERVAHRLISSVAYPVVYEQDRATYNDMVKYDSFRMDLYRVLALQEEGEILRMVGSDKHWGDYYQQSIFLCDQLIAKTSNVCEKALLYRYKGLAYQFLADKAAAKCAFNTSVDLLREKEDEFTLAKQLTGKAYALEKAHQYRKAVMWYDYVLWLYERSNSRAAKREMANILFFKGHVYNFYLNNDQKALICYEKSIAINEALINTTNKWEEKVTYKEEIALTLCCQAGCQRKLANEESALTLYAKSIAIWQELCENDKEDRKASYQKHIAMLHYNRGEIYYLDLAEYLEALTCLQEAVCTNSICYEVSPDDFTTYVAKYTDMLAQVKDKITDDMQKRAKKVLSCVVSCLGVEHELTQELFYLVNQLDVKEAAQFPLQKKPISSPGPLAKEILNKSFIKRYGMSKIIANVLCLPFSFWMLYVGLYSLFRQNKKNDPFVCVSINRVYILVYFWLFFYRLFCGSPIPFSIKLYELLDLQEKGSALDGAASSNEGLAYYQECLFLCDKLISIAPSFYDRSLLYCYKGLAYQNLGKEKKAKEAFDISIHLLGGEKDEVTLAGQMVDKGNSLEEKNQYRKALMWYDYALWLYRRNDPSQYKKEITNILNVKGEIYCLNLHNDEKALICFQESLEIKKQLANASNKPEKKATYKEDIASILWFQGICHGNLDHHLEEIRWYGKSIAVWAELCENANRDEKAKYQENMASLYYNQGMIYYLALAQYFEALICFQKAVSTNSACYQAYSDDFTMYLAKYIDVLVEIKDKSTATDAVQRVTAKVLSCAIEHLGVEDELAKQLLSCTI